MLGEQFQRTFAAFGLDHPVALVAQSADAEQAHDVFVLDQQNGADSGYILGWRGNRHGRSGDFGRCRVAREKDTEISPLARRALDINEPTGLANDAVDRRQTEPGAGADRLGRKERLEDAADDLLGNARAGIHDLDQHIIPRRHRFGAPSQWLRHPPIAGADRERTATGHGVAGVNGEIDDDLLELALVDLDLAEARPALRQNVVVEGATIRLGDLFDDAGAKAGEPVAAAPAPGRKILFEASWLSDIARTYRLSWRPASRYDRTVVERAGRRFDAAEITGRLRLALVAAGAPGDSEIEIANRDLEMFVAIEAPATIEIQNLSFDRNTSRFSAVAAVGGDHPSAARTAVNGRIYRTAQVPVLRRPIGAGDVIAKSDIEMVRIREERLRPGTIVDASDLIGFTPCLRVRAGDPVREDEIRPPILVAKNSLVTIVLRTNSMILTVQGKALEDGAKNDVIQVMNLQSKKILDGQVVESGTVTVAGQSILAAQ